MYDQDGIDTGIHKSKYHWADVSWNIMIKVKKYNIVSVSNIVPYKSKVIHVEYDIINFSPLIQNIDYYPREDNKYGDDFRMFIIDDGHLCDIVIAENIYIRRNKITERRDSVLSSLHIGGVKYRIYSSKTETAKNITIQKMI